MQCLNNLKQMGLALHNYHDANQSLPVRLHRQTPTSAGTYDDHRRATTPGWSFFALMLPYIEQGNLGNLIDYNLPILDPNNKVGRETMIKLFVCPSDTSPTDRRHRFRDDLVAADTTPTRRRAAADTAGPGQRVQLRRLPGHARLRGAAVQRRLPPQQQDPHRRHHRWNLEHGRHRRADQPVRRRTVGSARCGSRRRSMPGRAALRPGPAELPVPRHPARRSWFTSASVAATEPPRTTVRELLLQPRTAGPSS